MQTAVLFFFCCRDLSSCIATFGHPTALAWHTPFHKPVAWRCRGIEGGIGVVAESSLLQSSICMAQPARHIFMCVGFGHALSGRNNQCVAPLSQAMTSLMAECEEMANNLWHVAGTQYTMWALGNMPPFNSWGQERLSRYIQRGVVVQINELEDTKFAPTQGMVSVVLLGKVC